MQAIVVSIRKGVCVYAPASLSTLVCASVSSLVCLVFAYGRQGRGDALATMPTLVLAAAATIVEDATKTVDGLQLVSDLVERT